MRQVKGKGSENTKFIEVRPIVLAMGCVLLMTKFGKCIKTFSSNKVVSKIVSTKIVFWTRQLSKPIKSDN